ncbi:hypothetical protein HYX10_01800 [Candidatus Woesearchaeota archaeon]|nr:hypothetical protein [Candidatus Woesearchaeota archaeon]
MNDSDTKVTILAIVSIGIGLTALASQEYRILLVSIFSLFLAAYFLSAISDNVKGNSERIKTLERNWPYTKTLLTCRKSLLAHALLLQRRASQRFPSMLKTRHGL